MNFQTEAIPLSEIGEDVVKRIGHELVNFSLGFVKLEQTPKGETGTLAGSGTLVKVGHVFAILTAQHVVAELPRKGPLGLILSLQLERYEINAQDLHFKEIAHGTVPSEGPDIAAVILPHDLATSLAAKKSFVNLEKHRDVALSAPPPLNYGAWVLQGFVAERSREDAGTGRYSKVMAFGQFSFGCDPRPPVEVGGFDYYHIPVSFEGRPDLPQDFQGVSGGGLWQVALEKGAGGELTHRQPLLSGLAFYQGPIEGNRSLVRCHGRRSIYDIVYATLLR